MPGVCIANATIGMVLETATGGRIVHPEPRIWIQATYYRWLASCRLRFGRIRIGKSREGRRVADIRRLALSLLGRRAVHSRDREGGKDMAALIRAKEAVYRLLCDLITAGRALGL